MCREVVRVYELRDKTTLSNAKNSWIAAGCPGVVDYWVDELYPYRECVLSYLRSLGFTPLHPDWDYYNDYRYYISINIGDEFYNLTMPNDYVYSGPDRYYIPTNSSIPYSFLQTMRGDSWLHNYVLNVVDKSDLSTAGKACAEYLMLNVLEPYLNNVEVSLDDIDRVGSYAFLLFWSDTGKMLTEYEAEEWWCEHTLDEIKEMFWDVLEPVW